MWEILIIPIIGVAVWIISTLLRGEEEAKKPSGERGSRKPEKVTDLDRFLREVQRRRQAGEREPEPSQQTESRREERSAPSPQREEPVLVVVPEAQLVVVEPAAPTPVLVAEPIVAAPQLTVHEAPPLPQTMAPPTDHLSGDLPPARPQSRAQADLLRLLRSRDGMRKAMILQAVLGPPVSRRR